MDDNLTKLTYDLINHKHCPACNTAVFPKDGIWTCSHCGAFNSGPALNNKECPLCSGTGKLNESNCPNCSGTGYRGEKDYETP